jgi:hypothetical protein
VRDKGSNPLGTSCLAYPNIDVIFMYKKETVMKNSKLIHDLISGYSQGLITDDECCDMCDLYSNTITTILND